MLRSGSRWLRSQMRDSYVLSYRKYQRMSGIGSSTALCRQRAAVTTTKNSSLVECSKYLSVTPANRLPLSPISSLLIDPVATLVAVFLGIRIRRWWSNLSESERRQFWYKVSERRKQIAVAVAGTIGLFGVCCAAHTEVDPITGKRRLLLFTQQQLVDFSNIIIEELLNDVQYPVFPMDAPEYTRAKTIVMQVIHANKHYDRILDPDWFLIVVNDPSANAMVFPNGMIIVNSGLLYTANDDQVGFLLSHEISHCLLDHHAVRISREELLQFLWLIPVFLLCAIFPTPEAIFGCILGHHLKKQTMLLPYERDQELEADKYGLMLAANACIDIRQASLFWKKMEKYNPQNKDRWWKTSHPSHSSRVEYIENHLPNALQLRQQNGCPSLR